MLTDKPEYQGFDVLKLWLGQLKSTTARAYDQSVRVFMDFLGVDSFASAISMLFGHESSPGEANQLVLGFKNWLLERGLSPATINQRLSALRSLSKLFKVFGWISWDIYAPSVKSENYRDTRGPEPENYQAMLEQAASQSSKRKSVRDVAILQLLHGLGLRRGEVVRLDLSDLDFKAKTLWILGKGKREKIFLRLPQLILDKLRGWVALRGDWAGPLFVGLDQDRRTRLDGSSIYRIVRGLGAKVGIKTRPHGLRHLAITSLLKKTNGDITKVQSFSRHASIQTLMVYWHAAKDTAAQMADLLVGS